MEHTGYAAQSRADSYLPRQPQHSMQAKSPTQTQLIDRIGSPKSRQQLLAHKMPDAIEATRAETSKGADQPIPLEKPAKPTSEQSNASSNVRKKGTG